MAEPPGERIVDVINRVTKDGGTVISCEFFPARTASGVAALLRRVEETVLQLRPHFVAVTWRAQFKDEDLWLAIGSQIQKNVGVVSAVPKFSTRCTIARLTLIIPAS